MYAVEMGVFPVEFFCAALRSAGEWEPSVDPPSIKPVAITGWGHLQIGPLKSVALL
jgi:hypothetical protein